MAVVSVKPFDSSGGGGRKVTERNYSAVYTVWTDDPNDGPNTARFADGIPAFGATFAFGNDTDAGVFCNGKKATLAEGAGTSRKKWYVTCDYSNDGKSCSDEQYDSPLDEPPIITWDYASTTEIIDKDIDGVSIASSAGEKFDPGIEKDKRHLIIRIAQNISSDDFDDALFETYIDCLNDATLWGRDPGTVKMSPFTAEKKFLGTCEEFYFALNWEFETNPDGWDLVLEDVGFYELVDGKRKTILDDREGDEGGPRYINQPVYLDGAGRKLAPVLGEYTPVDLPPFKLFARMDFSALPIPAALY